MKGLSLPASGLSTGGWNDGVDTKHVKGRPGAAGRDDDPRRRLRAAARGRRWGALSSRSASPAERKGVSPQVTRLVYAPQRFDTRRFSLSTSVESTATQALGAVDDRRRGALLDELQSSADARRIVLSKRPATLWCARSGGPGPSAAGRAPATNGSRTTGGAVVVRFAVEAECCGRLGCGRSDGLLMVDADGERRVLCARCARRWSA